MAHVKFRPGYTVDILKIMTPLHFPWQVLSGPLTTRPVYGPPHAYICRVLSVFCQDPAERTIFAGGPTQSDLRRLTIASEGRSLAGNILDHCEAELKKKMPTDAIVISFLGRVRPFMEQFEVRVQAAWRSGKLAVEESCLIPDRQLGRDAHGHADAVASDRANFLYRSGP